MKLVGDTQVTLPLPVRSRQSPHPPSTHASTLWTHGLSFILLPAFVGDSPSRSGSWLWVNAEKPTAPRTGVEG